ncbi:NlpC/P60 family protein [Alkalibaculum bacchi]|uniref:NlpC/P60 family protein n=1 Tax=Alkalibaculum bacchi TaxID=645887 RepID=A0A366HXM5_9FIRM|nr:C40 family peptidase [Alkalibaculum bacchi]RBP58434.1 NlpC/P60 family protein [Alkalibaculum bacchi]
MSQKSKRPFRPAGKVSRLTFTDEERADPELEKPLKKAEKAGDKLEKAQAKIPKKKSLATERTFDAKTGKAKVRLYFEETDKPKPTSKLSHAVKTIPQKELLNKIHKEIREGEQDNVGVEAAHNTEQGIEFGERRIQSGYRSHKLKPYRNLAKAEKQTVKAEVNYLYKKSLRDNSQTLTNPISRWQQRQAIKKQYLANRYGKGAKTAHQTAKNTKTAVKNSASATEKITQLIVRNKKGILIALGIGVALMFLISTVSSCSILMEGGLQSIVGTSYTSEDEDIVAVDEDYETLERALQVRIDNIESEYPGYDEYQYHLDEIGHNPFTLASYLTAKLQVYKQSEVEDELRALFHQQYSLTTHEEVEVRYRTETRTDTWTDEDGNTHSDTYTVEVPYDYYILHITLKNKDISILATNNLTDEQNKMFAVYMETQGNKPYLFKGNIYAPNKGEYTDYDIPPDALTDPDFAALINEAEKYLGYPYVWGGSSPSTSFDCSGFVCWVLNQSGVYPMNQTTAQGIFNQCAIIPPSEARPGDIIFFTGTYASSGAVSHVGIYVGNGMMIHCGNPIQYASVNSTYWTQHFYAYGRLN